MLRPAVMLVAMAAGETIARAQDPLAAIEAQQRALFDLIAPSVAFISRTNAFGSGFFIDSQGLLLTNAHVVGNATTVDVVLHDGRRLRGEVIERAKDDIDLALVRVAVTSAPVLPLAKDGDLSVGNWVGSVGHGAGGVWTFNAGMVSNIYPMGLQRPVFQTQIPLNPGSSGGPIFDRRGTVVGIVTSGLTESNSINFGIKTETIVASLEGLRHQCACLRIKAPENVAVFLNGKMVGKGPNLVVPVKSGAHEVFAVIKGKMHKRSVNYPTESDVALP